MPNRNRLTRMALRTLEDALARAHNGSVEPLWGIRTALALLVDHGAADRQGAADFWRHMLEPAAWDGFESNAQYERTIHLRMVLSRCYAAIRLPEPDLAQRARWAQAYAPDNIDSLIGPPHLWPMCNRYQPGERTRIDKLFGARPLRAFNSGPPTVHPKDPGWVVRREGTELVLDQMTWGFPMVLRGKSGQLLKPRPVNNARFDKLNGFWRRWTAPANRCLIPTSRFAEAIGAPGHMTTAWLSLRDQPIFAWAGLWGHSDEWGDVYTGVMTDAAPELLDIHDRMPVILAKADWHTWLDAPLPELRRFDRAWPAEDIVVDKTWRPWKEGWPDDRGG